MNIHRFRRSTLFLQTLLILLPITILSGIALYSLRQDRALIEWEARERARTMAPEIAQRLGRGASQQVNRLIADQSRNLDLALRFPVRNEPTAAPGATTGDESRVDPESTQLQCLIIDGRIRVPADFPDVPVPPDWPTAMTAEPERRWRAAEQAFYRQRDLVEARRAVAALAASKPPEPARASAEFGLLLLAAGERKDSTRSRYFTDLARRYPDALAPSGASVADLSLIHALRRSVPDALPEALWGELVHRVIARPSFLTVALLEEAERSMRTAPMVRRLHQLQTLWLAHERTRRLLRALARQPSGMIGRAQVWLQLEGHSFLALSSPFAGSTGGKEPPAGNAASYITLIPAARLEKAFQTALDENRRDLPAYAGVRIQVADRSWTLSGITDNPAAKRPPPELAELAAAVGQLELRHEIPAVLLFGLREDLGRAAPRATSGRSLGSGEPVGLTGPSGSHRFQVALELADPNVLYSGYRRRVFLASGLVVSAAVAALVGLFSTWRAFERQMRLGDMKSNFVSSVSHELRAPLASVRLMAESLERGRVPDEARRQEYYRLIVRECGRLSSLVENVLDFSHISQGRKRYEFEPVDLRALVAETVRSMEAYAAERKVRLAFSESSEVSQSFQPCWDGPAIQEALVNLIDNAIKHSPAASTVEVALEPARDDAPVLNRRDGAFPRMRISVRDQGQGIPDDEQAKIFEPFYRRGSELRRETRGVGIGLSIVRHVAEGHGGRVEVHSIVGEGSRFVLDLPVSPPARSR
jgi:signal transduction histidine kinase